MTDTPSGVENTPAFLAESPKVAPVDRSERISSVDIIRGVALLGILLMNIISFGLPGEAYMDPTIAGGAAGRNLGFWFVNQVLFEGKMRALFSMLFGAGVFLFTSRAEERRGAAVMADVYYRRTLWLLAFGLTHAYLIWSGDILYSYAIVGLMLFPLRHLSPKTLLIVALVMLSVSIPKNIMGGREIEQMRADAAKADAIAAQGRQLTDEQKEAQKAWKDKLKEMKPDAKALQKEIDDHRGGY